MSTVVRAGRRPQKKGGLGFTSTSLKRSQPCETETYPSAPSPKRARTSSPAPVQSPKTRILIISDTHGLSTLPSIQDANIDVVIHCGDLSKSGSLEDYQNSIQLLNDIPAPLKLVIPGNHDLTLDPVFWAANSTEKGADLHNQAKELFSTKKGIQLLDDGRHEITLPNGRLLKLYANSKTVNPSGAPEWAFPIPSSDDDINPIGKGISYAKSIGTSATILEDNEEIDIILSHAPAKYRLDQTENGDSIGCPHLFRAVRRLRPKLVACGHAHAGYGAEAVVWNESEKLPLDDDDEDGIKTAEKLQGRKEGNLMVLREGRKGETMFVNGALMGHHGLGNMPWLVEIELGRT